jgi:hypothetical protein
MNSPLRDRLDKQYKAPLPVKRIVPEWVRRMHEGKLPAKDYTR